MEFDLKRPFQGADYEHYSRVAPYALEYHIPENAQEWEAVNHYRRTKAGGRLLWAGLLLIFLFISICSPNGDWNVQRYAVVTVLAILLVVTVIRSAMTLNQYVMVAETFLVDITPVYHMARKYNRYTYKATAVYEPRKYVVEEIYVLSSDLYRCNVGSKFYVIQDGELYRGIGE